MSIDVQIIDGDTELTDDDKGKLEDILSVVVEEYVAASSKFGAFKSGHEGLAIIQEEFEELKEAVFWPHKTDGDATTEATQLAAMAIRYLIDIAYA